MNYLYVMIGGALGAASRYGLGQLLSGFRALSMPLGTMGINLLGCFLLGILTALAQKNVCLPFLDEEQSHHLMLLLTVGFCGAFTTFSTFSAETIKAIEGGLLWQPLLYVLTSIVVGLLLFWWGKHLI